MSMATHVGGFSYAKASHGVQNNPAWTHGLPGTQPGQVGIGSMGGIHANNNMATPPSALNNIFGGLNTAQLDPVVAQVVQVFQLALNALVSDRDSERAEWKRREEAFVKRQSDLESLLQRLQQQQPPMPQQQQRYQVQQTAQQRKWTPRPVPTASARDTPEMDGEKWSGGNVSGNNSSDSWWHDYDESEQYIFHRNDVFYSFLTAYLLVAVLAVFGNFLVILVVQCDRQVESKTNFLLGQLAVADLCVGVFCVMQSFMAYLSNWSLGLFMCQMYLYVQALSYVASVLIMVAVCVERYVAIMQPFHTRSVFTTARLRLIVLLVWLVSAAYASPRLFFARVTSQELRNDETDTFCHLDTTRYDPEIFDTANLIFLYVIPLFVMAVMYSRMCVELWQSGRQIPGAVHAGRVPCNPSTAPVPDAPSALTTTSLLHLVPEPGEHTALQPCLSIPDNQSVASEIVQGGPRSPLPSPQPPLQRMSSLPPLRETRDPLRPCNSPRPKRKERKVWRRFFHKRSQSRRSNDLEVGPLQARRRVVYMLILVVLSFLLCNLPYHARKMWQVRLLSAENMVYYQLFTPCTFLIMYFNSALNPILYATMSLSFRRAMRRRLRLIARGAFDLCRRRQRQGSPTLLVRGAGKAGSSSTRSSTRAANAVVQLPPVATNGHTQPETGV